MSMPNSNKHRMTSISIFHARTRCHSSRNLLHVDHVLFDDETQRTARAHPTRGNVGSFLESPWAVLGNVGAFLGRSCEDFRATWVVHVAVLGNLGNVGASLTHSWKDFRSTWVIHEGCLGSPRGSQGYLGSTRSNPGQCWCLLGAFLEGFQSHLQRPRGLLR